MGYTDGQGAGTYSSELRRGDGGMGRQGDREESHRFPNIAARGELHQTASDLNPLIIWQAVPALRANRRRLDPVPI